MSCIKFPSSKSDLSKMSNKENINYYADVNSQLVTDAHETFGQGNWSHTITSQTLDFVDYCNGKYQAGCASIVKLQVKTGEFHEAMGYHIAEGSSKGSSILKVRLGSFNDAFKKALKYFVNYLANKSKFQSRPGSPLPVESSVIQLPIAPDKIPSMANTIDEAFAENIPMSQADALMDIVEMDQLFEKDQQLNEAKESLKEVKSTVSQSHIFTANKEEKEKDVVHIALNSNKDIKISSSTNNGMVCDNMSVKSSKPMISYSIKKEKTCVNTTSKESKAMTEEEMRLERKRKQREMQEEFKRKEEMKKMHIDNTLKQNPNPKY